MCVVQPPQSRDADLRKSEERNPTALVRCLFSLKPVWPSRPASLIQSKQLAWEHHSQWSAFLMLCLYVCECGTLRHDVCEAQGDSAGFVDGVINSSVVLGQPRTCPQRSLLRVRNIVFRPSFWMAMFVKCIWMYELEC